MKFSVFRALKHDYILLGALIFIVVAIGFGVYDNVTDQSLPSWTISIPFISLFILIWRGFILLSFYNKGIEVPDTIVDVSFYRDRGRVTYIYTVDGIEYKRGNAIMKTKETKSLKKGLSVSLLYKEMDPKKTIIGYLYGK